MSIQAKARAMLAAAIRIVGEVLPLPSVYTHTKTPKTVADYDAVVTAEIKRRRKNAKRLHNQKKGNTK